jgi:malate permease and related proteins
VWRVTEIVRILFDILGPVFVLVLAGVAVGKWLSIPAQPLAKLAYWLIGPAFVFDALSHADLAPQMLGRLTLAAAGAFTVSASIAYVMAQRLPGDRRAAIVTTGAYGNVGNFGLAIVLFSFGDGARPYAAVAMVVVNGLGLILAVTLADGGLAGFSRALRSPMTLMIPPALLVNSLDLDMPLVVDRPAGLLAGAIIPVMLVTLGIQLHGIGRPKFDADVIRSLVVKLLVQPVVAIPIAAGLGLTGDAAGAIVLQAAMPAAVFAAVIAIELDARADEIATIVMAGTLVSMLTLPWFILYVT